MNSTIQSPEGACQLFPFRLHINDDDPRWPHGRTLGTVWVKIPADEIRKRIDQNTPGPHWELVLQEEKFAAESICADLQCSIDYEAIKTPMNLTAQILATGNCLRSPRPKKKRGRGIPAMSEKRKEDIKVYTQLRKKFLKENPMCEAGVNDLYLSEAWGRDGMERRIDPSLSYVCTKRATQVHHTKKRGKNYLNVESFMPICAPCHRWIEEHKDQARELGWLAY